MGPIDFNCMGGKNAMQVSLVTDILQNILFCVQQKELHTGLEQCEG